MRIPKLKNLFLVLNITITYEAVANKPIQNRLDPVEFALYLAIHLTTLLNNVWNLTFLLRKRRPKLKWRTMQLSRCVTRVYHGSSNGRSSEAEPDGAAISSYWGPTATSRRFAGRCCNTTKRTSGSALYSSRECSTTFFRYGVSMARANRTELWYVATLVGDPCHKLFPHLVVFGVELNGGSKSAETRGILFGVRFGQA
ncbi:hypothetical protein OUZ56_021513 [Daphnia magna]|uniref:Uncharacterized protein n=1 Tax=Daphnia magna TaxID=35525 RepID=A0ABQ9ZJ07_9CRUS|nr:hypothetical protein OUZ56_021513 [Daphnia magna]